MISKLLVASYTAIGIFTSANTINLGWDGGGYVSEYLDRVDAYTENNTKIHFQANCMSACTLYLALPRKNLCYDKPMYFLFHAAFIDPIDPKTGKPSGDPKKQTYSETWTKVVMKKLPPDVREAINANGGLKFQQWMSFPASRFIEPCKTITNREKRGDMG